MYCILYSVYNIHFSICSYLEVPGAATKQQRKNCISDKRCFHVWVWPVQSAIESVDYVFTLNANKIEPDSILYMCVYYSIPYAVYLLLIYLLLLSYEGFVIVMPIHYCDEVIGVWVACVFSLVSLAITVFFDKYIVLVESKSLAYLMHAKK